MSIVVVLDSGDLGEDPMMTGDGAMPSLLAPGFFGKVPARGDFVSRRISATLLADWEAWLATLVVAAREALGRSWPDDWLTAPLWHFALGRGMAPPNGAAGVLVASMDRVGRFYPFIVIGVVGAAASNRAALYDWSGCAEALTLAALEDDFDPDRLDAALVALGPPPALCGTVLSVGHWPLVLDGDWPSIASANADALAGGAEQSVWFCRGSDRVPPVHLRCNSFPDRATAAAMITGDFDLSAA